MTDYKKLQNGSDIRGVAVEGVAGQSVNLTPVEAKVIAIAFTQWLSEGLNRKAEELTVAIGRDPRISGPDLESGLIEGFVSEGVHVFDCGMASTPAMFMSTIFSETECDGAIMITASHLPYNRNGFKFFIADGGLNKNDITYILTKATSIAEDGVSANACACEGKVDAIDLMNLYSAYLRQLIIDGTGIAEEPLKGMKITVDAGNGSGGFYATDVLAPLGADVTSSQFLDPDGTFPNHSPNPEDKAAMDSISEKVLASGADLGIIFDTDVDRSAAVDSRGYKISRNGIVAMAAALVAEDNPGATVVTDSITSRQLTAFIEGKLGLQHLRFKRGYKNVINRAMDLCASGTDCPLAIETSGHAALRENHFLDDGAYLATKIVIKAARLHLEGMKIDSVIEGLEEPLEEREIRIPLIVENFSEAGDEILEQLEHKVKDTDGIELEEPNYEGVRINFPQGWVLLRKSLHDPIMPMNIAADVEGGCEVISNWMKDFLAQYDSLDLSVF